MTAAEFRTVTVLHTEEDTNWCNYVVDKFRADKLHVKIVTLNVASLDYENPPEIQAAVAESYVVMFMSTCYMLDYLERHHDWLVPMLKAGDKNVTTIVAALLEVTPSELSDFTNQYSYDTAREWETIEIDVTGANIKECIVKILEITDRNKEKLTKRIPARTYSDRTTHTSAEAMDKVEMVPRYVQEAGDTIALIFTKEKTKGSVKVYAGGTPIDCETVNPYCVTFKAPEMTSTKIKIQVEANNTKLRPLSLRAMKTPHFTSIELMCQSYGVSKKEDLDKKLAETFMSSLSANSRAMMLFTDNIKNVQTGNRNCLYPTLLHWAAANGLKELCSALLSAPGANHLCSILNKDDDDVIDLAHNNGYTELADFIADFMETKNIADACEYYVQFCKDPSESSPIYEDMSRNVSGKTTSPTLPPRNPAPFPVSPRLPSVIEDDDIYVTPDVVDSFLTPKEFINAKMKPMLPSGATGLRSQAELIEIQEEVKKGNFSIREAEMLFCSWKSRYETGNAISFKEKQQSLHIMRNEYQKHIDVFKDKCVKQKKGKKQESAISQAVPKISDPVGMRKMVVAMPPGLGPAREVSGGSLSRASHDSGRYSSRDSNISQASTSSEEYEGFDEGSPLIRGNRSQSERSTDRSPDVRHSTRDLYLELTRVSGDIPELHPPPLPPPRVGNPETREIKKLPTPNVKPKPGFTPKPDTSPKPGFTPKPDTSPKPGFSPDFTQKPQPPMPPPKFVLPQKPQPPVPPKKSTTLPRSFHK